MPVVLGISNTAHDTSAALFIDGSLAAAVSEERLCRIKCMGGLIPDLAIAEVLRIAGKTRQDVDHIGMTHGYYPDEYLRRPSLRQELFRKIKRASRRLRHKQTERVWSEHLLRDAMGLGKTFEDFFRYDLFLRNEGFRPDAKLSFHRHHAVHALLAGYYSGFGECMVITADGYGDLDEVHTSNVYRNGKIDVLAASHGYGQSAGMFYESITELLGFRPGRHEGKVLGLAAFGDPAPLLEPFKKALRASPDNKTFISDFVGDRTSHQRRHEYLASVIVGHSRENIAAAAQQTLEDAYLAVVRRLAGETGLRTIALNGGVSANVKLNQRIAALPEIDKVFVFPGMSDTGNSVGACLFAQELAQPGFLARTQHVMEDVYLGPGFADDEIETALKTSGLDYEKLDEATLIDRSARAIDQGWVVGWFQGRMEFGPRALGNRSMIGRPTDAAINKSLNDRLERTEFMPFAPSVLAEYADELFEGTDKSRHAAEFMTITYDVKPEWHARIPAVVHIDGTARPQLVRRDRNPRYYKVIDRYRELSGIPLVLNTSFNVHEEPIVCAPAEGIRAVREDRIDALAIGNFWVDNPARASFR
jgi:carbamoyltransferase